MTWVAESLEAFRNGNPEAYVRLAHSFRPGIYAYLQLREDSVARAWGLTHEILESLAYEAALEPHMDFVGRLWEETRKRASNPMGTALSAKDQVAQCIEALPEAQQDIFSMYHFGGFSLTELAEAAGVGAEQLGALHREADRAFRTCIEAYASTEIS